MPKLSQDPTEGFSITSAEEGGQKRVVPDSIDDATLQGLYCMLQFRGRTWGRTCQGPGTSASRFLIIRIEARTLSAFTKAT
jgi:hypothetical protein